MKRWTRKLLAGLLSVGMLLQVASPLSALADSGTSTAPTLTVEIGTQSFTVSPAEDGKAQVNNLEAWTDAVDRVSSIDYANGTYTFHDGIKSNGNAVKITGNGTPSIVMDVDGTAVNGSLTVRDVKDVILTKENMTMEPVVVGDVDITCTGDVRIKNNCTNYDAENGEMEAVSGSLTVKTSGDVKIRGMVNSSKGGSVVIDTTGVVELSSPNGPVSGKGLTVKNASYVGISSRNGIFGTRGDLAFENCTLIELKDDYTKVLGSTDIVTIWPDSYRLYAGYNESFATQKASLNACRNDHYIRIETGAESQAKPVATLTVLDEFSSYYTTVTYILNRYENGSVSWKNGQKPWGDDVRVEYDAAKNTYVFTGTLSELAESNEDRVTMICSDEEDSILIDGKVSAATLSIGIGTDTSGAKNLTIQSNSTEPAVRETITLNCSGNVSITNPSGAITGSSSYDSGVYCYGASQNFIITGNSTDSLTGGGLRLYAKESITVENLSGPVTGSSFIVKDRDSTAVKIIGNSSGGLMQSSDATADITAATLTMENKSGNVGKVEFTRTDTISPYRVAVGESESNNTQTALEGTTYSATVDEKYLNIQPGTPENTTVKHTLTLTNAKAYTDENHTVEADKNEAGIYSVAKGTKVYVVAEAPDNVSRWKFTGWEGSSETSSEPRQEITVTVNGDMTLTAKWEKGTDPATNYGITVTIGDTLPIEVTSNNRKNILGDDYTSGKLTYDPDTHTLTGTGSFGEMEVEITSNDLEGKVDVVLRNDVGATTPVVDGALTVTGAKDVKVTGASSSALINGETTINCAGDIRMKNTGTGNVIGTHGETDLVVNNARSVTIENEGTGNDSYAIYGRVDINNCSGNVEIVSNYGKAIWDPIVVRDAKNVTIKAAGRAIWDGRHKPDTIMTKIECSGTVEITSGTEAALYEGNLIITGATDVTISGNRNDGATIGGAADISCSGDVVLENKGTGAVVKSKLVYKQNPAKGYEVKTGVNAESATVAYTDEGGTTSYTVPKTETDPVPSYISITAVGAPPVVPGDDDFTGGDSGAGGAVAAVLMGGAAVWGGYEIATRVILHNILPEGTAIPANRGQLALLVWNNAGRPAPVNEPAFVDMDDADMAKAAQWCVEQGIMEAKTAETFKPEGWTPKLKVIEVWNKAFPKQ